MQSKRKISLALAILVLAGILAGCGDPTATSVAPTTTASTTPAATTAAATQANGTTAVATGQTATTGGGVFRWVWPSEPRTLDPALLTSADSSALHVGENLFEGPVELDQDLKVVPAAAALPEVSADGKTYTFRLRKGQQFSNGDPLTAQDFVYSWNRVAQLGALSPNGQMFSLIEGFNQVYQEKDDAKRAAATVSGIKALDDYTIEIKLTEPASYFLTQVALSCYWPVDKKAVEAKGSKLDAKNPWASDAATFVGNGPFLLKEWKHDAGMRLEPNPAYTGSPKPSLSAVTIEFIKDAATSKLKYDNNELDDVGAPVADLQNLKKDPKYKGAYKDVPLALTTWLSFNYSKENPFSQNLKLRQAVTYAIDRQLITEGALNGAALPTTVLVPKGFPGYQEMNTYPFNPDKAKQLFKEAGYDTPEKVKALSDLINNWGEGKGGGLAINTDRNANKVWMENVQQQLKTNLGLELKLNAVSTQKEYAQRLEQHEFILFRANWSASYPDPQNYYDTAFISTSGTNYSGYKNPAYDELVKKANTTTATGQRLALYQQAEQLLQAEAVYVPLFNAIDMRLVRPTIQNWGYTPQGAVRLKYMVINKG
jgi:oligopeptide transport system substrate-binding protein